MLFSNDCNHQLKLLHHNIQVTQSVTSSSFKIDDILNKSEKINFSKILNENNNSKRLKFNNGEKTVNQQDFNSLFNNSLYSNQQVPSSSSVINEQFLHNLEQQRLKDQVCCKPPEENYKKSEKMRRKSEKKNEKQNC